MWWLHGIGIGIGMGMGALLCIGLHIVCWPICWVVVLYVAPINLVDRVGHAAMHHDECKVAVTNLTGFLGHACGVVK